VQVHLAKGLMPIVPMRFFLRINIGVSDKVRHPAALLMQNCTVLVCHSVAPDGLGMGLDTTTDSFCPVRSEYSPPIIAQMFVILALLQEF